MPVSGNIKPCTPRVRKIQVSPRSSMPHTNNVWKIPARTSVAPSSGHCMRAPCDGYSRSHQTKMLAFAFGYFAPADSSIAQDEIFGPLLQIETYSDIRDAVSKINAGDLPLALYYFGHDAQEERWVLDNTRSGGVTINDVLIHVAAHDAPFGGVGASGMGKYHGKEGFLEFSHARTVYRSGWWDPRKTFGLVPPYSEKVFSQLRKSIR